MNSSPLFPRYPDPVMVYGIIYRILNLILKTCWRADSGIFLLESSLPSLPEGGLTQVALKCFHI